MIKLRVNKDFFLDMDSGASIMEGSDINIVVELSEDFPVSIINNMALDYKNGKYRDRDLVTTNTPIVLQKPFNRHGYLDLQIVFDTQTQGWRKTNTVTTKIHRSINAGPVDRDLEEVYEIIRQMQNELADKEERISELETKAAVTIDYVEATQMLQLKNLKDELVSETSLASLTAIKSIEWSDDEDAYILTKTDGTAVLMDIPARVE